MPDHRARLDERRLGTEHHKHHDGGCHRDGRRRVHRDAKGAAVGIAVERMEMRHLNHGQQGQQEETHNDRNRQSAVLCLANAA